MPEGPSLVILRELTQALPGQRILAATGTAKLDQARLVGQRIVALRTWGKHFLIEFQGFSLRIHLLMFGSYCIDSRKDRAERLGLKFARGRELNFYACAVRYLEGSLEETYCERCQVRYDSTRTARSKVKRSAASNSTRAVR
jgi:endonuclease-8